MEWSKTKTIFIITFLLLNIFLGFQLSEKREASNLNLLTQTSFQENLDENEIKIEISNSDETKVGSPVSGSFRFFDQEILNEELEGQQIKVLVENQIYSTLETPYRLGEGDIHAVVSEYVQQHVLYGDQYRFTNYNEEEKFIGFHQTYEERPIDNSLDVPYHLKINLNEELEIISYEQVYMDISLQGREQELLSPIKAIEILFDDNYIPANTTIDHVELWYYNPLQGMVDLEFTVFAPMWKIKVVDMFYYVNAINGEIQPINKME